MWKELARPYCRWFVISPNPKIKWLELGKSAWRHLRAIFVSARRFTVSKASSLFAFAGVGLRSHVECYAVMFVYLVGKHA